MYLALVVLPDIDITVMLERHTTGRLLQAFSDGGSL